MQLAKTNNKSPQEILKLNNLPGDLNMDKKTFEGYQEVVKLLIEKELLKNNEVLNLKSKNKLDEWIRNQSNQNNSQNQIPQPNSPPIAASSSQ